MSELINSFADFIRSFGVPDYLVIFIISLFPILELRGGLVAAAVLKLKLIPSFIVCFLGNILPVYFIVKYAQPIFKFLGKIKPIGKILDWFTEKTTKKIEKLIKKFEK